MSRLLVLLLFLTLSVCYASEPGVQTAWVTVIGNKGNKADLPAEAFSVEEDGKQSKIAQLSFVDGPCAVAFDA